ncbi:DUF695 domain-containing protein [Cellulophaga sp. Z1A5H]|uniref:DUF695 domain-containing protein n=1 Tax=Cellulophaga sp. Z1A5H TaxID=2687291 RepID=UPI0013FE2F39|nr:DUF695 domain-containing protein [Cellulophaga sp. Z1A5H]
MFKKFFNKKKEEQPLEIKHDWASYFCRVEDKPASIRLNLALHDRAPIENYKHRIWFSIKLLNPDENGFTTREEFPVICSIEDAIAEALEKIGAIFVGALKTNGTFDMYSYSRNIENLDEVIHGVMKNFSDYNYATDTKEDTQWDTYFNFLYPGVYEYQTILNQKVLIDLHKQGDNPEIEREIDHWLYFETEKDRDTFILKSETLGYKMLSKQTMKEGDHLYQLNISKVSDANSATINANVWELISLAKENNGSYDGWGCPIAG